MATASLSPPGSPTPAGSAGPPGPSDEWTAARSNIERFDGYLDALRKFGFSLVTTLLTAVGVVSSATPAVLSDPGKLVVVDAILVLVIALAFLDGQYRALQRGASVRARILERSLDFDLTSAMAAYLQLGRYRLTYFLIYSLIAVSSTILGIGLLWGDTFLLLLVLVSGALAIFLIYSLGGDSLRALIDWSVNTKVVPHDEPVRITFTNLQERTAGTSLVAGAGVYALDFEYTKKLAVRECGTKFMSQADWVWSTKGEEVKEGLYQIVGWWNVLGTDGKPLQSPRGFPADGIADKSTLELPGWSPPEPIDAPLTPEASGLALHYDPALKPRALTANVAALDPKSWRHYTLTVQVVKALPDPGSHGPSASPKHVMFHGWTPREPKGHPDSGPVSSEPRSEIAPAQVVANP